MSSIHDRHEDRAAREIAHGRMLADGDTEEIWGWGSAAGQVRFRRRAEAIAGGARLQPGRRALELGCGTGLFTAEFARTGAAVTAIEISPDLLEKARRQPGAEAVTWVLGRFESTPMDGAFDAVIGSSVLHHLEVAPSLARIRELLAPGGTLCFAEPNLLNPQVFLERKFRAYPPFNRYVSPDETAFARFGFARQLTAAGFVDVTVTPFDWVHPSIPAPAVPLAAFVGRVLEALPLVRECAGSLLIRARRPEHA